MVQYFLVLYVVSFDPLKVSKEFKALLNTLNTFGCCPPTPPPPPLEMLALIVNQAGHYTTTWLDHRISILYQVNGFAQQWIHCFKHLMCISPYSGIARVTGAGDNLKFCAPPPLKIIPKKSK